MRTRAIWLGGLLLVAALDGGCTRTKSLTYYPTSPGARGTALVVTARAGGGYELTIDGQPVTTLRWPAFHTTASVKATHRGKAVEVQGKVLPFLGVVIDVFIDGQRAGNFVFNQ